MHYRDGFYCHTGAVECITVINLNQAEMRHSRIRMLGKAVSQPALQGINNITTSKDGHILKSSQFLKATNVIVMNVSNENSIKLGASHAQVLLAKVGATVNQDVLATVMHQRRLAQTLITRVG